MNDDKQKDIPLEIVDTSARDEEAVVAEGLPLDEKPKASKDVAASTEVSGQSEPSRSLARGRSHGAKSELSENAESLEASAEPKSAGPAAKPAPKKVQRRKAAKEDADIVKEGIELKQVISDQAREDEREGSFNQSLKKILVGEMLNSKILRDNVGVMILVVVFVVINITNRYTVQQQLLEQSKLKKELQDTKFRALSASSELTERTRKSRIMEALSTTRDSTLKEPAHPAFLINVPSK